MKWSSLSVRILGALIPLIGLTGVLGLILSSGQPVLAADPLVAAISLTASPNPSVFGQMVGFTASVTGGGVTPTGTITFKVGTATLGSGAVTLDASGQAVLNSTALIVGTHSITAQYSGDTVYAAKISSIISQVVNKADATILVNSISPSVAGQGVTFTASVSSKAPGMGTPGGSVQFKIDGANFGSPVALAGGIATSAVRSDLNIANHIVTALYGGDASFNTGASAAYSHLVNKIDTATQIISSQNPSTATQPVTFTATVSTVSPGTGIPAGSVQFKIDGIDYRTPVTLSVGQATSVGLTTLSTGSHSVTAVYSGAGNMNSSTATEYTQVVAPNSRVTTQTLMPGMVDLEYTQTLKAANGVSPYSWTLSSGTLPTGLVLNSEGVISGTPGAAGTFWFNVTVTDDNGFTSAKALKIVIRGSNYVQAWGYNNSGQLGDELNSSINFSKIPLAVNSSNLDSAIMVSAGYQHSLAIGSDGYIWVWGNNDSGQLGTGNAVNKTIPTYKDKNNKIILNDIVMVSAGFQHSLALQSNGIVWAWGSNEFGQLGDGSTTNSNVPVIVSELPPDIVAISAGYFHSLALTSDGDIWAWGSNQYGQLGDNTTSDRLVPVKVFTESSSEYRGDFTAIEAGKNHSVALTSAKYVWAWGRNNLGQVGDNSTTDRKYPVKTRVSASVDLTEITSIAAGGDFSLALKSAATVWAWGENSSGQLGINSTALSSFAKQVKTGSSTFLIGITAISAGGSHSLALKSDSTVWAWGGDEYGQLGNNDTANTRLAVQVKTSASAYIFNATAISAGGFHSLGLSSTNITAVTINTASLSAGTKGVPYSQTLSASGGSGAYTWSKYSGTLPTGLYLNASTGNIYGTPTVANDFTFVIKAADSTNAALYDTASFEVSIVTNTEKVYITTSSLEEGMVNVAYSQTLEIDGGSGSVSWYKYAGSLPPGLNLNAATGRITGMPTTEGEFTFSLKVVDNEEDGLSDTASFSITILANTARIMLIPSGLTAPSSVEINYLGYAEANFQLTTPDNRLTLAISNGTRLLDSAGKPLSALSASALSSVLTPLSGISVVSSYDLGPNGATFNPPLTLIFKYVKANLPASMDENSLYIALYDGTQWVRVAGAINTAAGTLSAPIDHFSRYALLGNVIASPTPATTPSPSLTVSTTVPVPIATATTSQLAPTPQSEKSPAKFNWWLVIWIIGGVLIVLIIILVISQRQNRMH
jgi:alpha-tubulin suppressor-like RCC1 family protein